MNPQGYITKTGEDNGVPLSAPFLLSWRRMSPTLRHAAQHHDIRRRALPIPAPLRGLHAASLSLGLWLSLYGGLYAQAAKTEAAYSMRSWTTSEGLPYNVVSKVAQDQQGYLWIASLGGLARFDGRVFKLYPVPKEDLGGGRNIRDLGILPDGSVLLIHASRGLLQLKNDSFGEHPLSRELSGSTPLQLHLEPNGTIWVGTAAGLLRWEKGQVDRFPVPDDGSQRTVYFSWASDRMNRTWVAGPSLCAYYDAGRLVRAPFVGDGNCYVANSRDRKMWVYSGKLYSYDGDRLVEVANVPWMSAGLVRRALLEDAAGSLWLSSWREGLFRFDGQNFLPVPGVPTAVRSFFEDTEGNLWAGTNGAGISRIRRSVFSQLDLQTPCLTEDAAGVLWFAAGTGGVGKFAAPRTVPQIFPCADSSIEVTTVCADPTGSLWIGTLQGVFKAPAQNPSAMHFTGITGKVHATFLSRSGDVWMSGQGLLGYFRNGTFFPLATPLALGEEFTCFAEDRKGQLLLGASLGGLYELSGKLIAPSKRTPAPLSGRVNAIWPDEDGLLWVGTSDGLRCLGNGDPKRLAKEDGLPDNLVNQVLGDGLGNLWLTSNRELYRIAQDELLEVASGRKRRLEAITYANDQGLSGVSPRTFCAPSAVKDQRGIMWFCNYRGVMTVDPAGLQRAPHARSLFDRRTAGGRPPHPDSSRTHRARGQSPARVSVCHPQLHRPRADCRPTPTRGFRRRLDQHRAGSAGALCPAQSRPLPPAHHRL